MPSYRVGLGCRADATVTPRMLSRRPLLALPTALLLVLAVLTAPGAASAQGITWVPCGGSVRECAHVQVPLDHSGRTPGTVTLAVERYRAPSNPTRTAVVGLAGGPGQAALPLRASFVETMQAALGERDLLLFDQRGTGGSGPLSCAALNQAGTLVSLSRRCALQIGARRAFYRTPDTVADIEALRAGAGYERLVLFGVSYGTKVALAYAAAHPERVEALVLDSVVLPEGPDAFRRSTFKATPRILRDLCARRACARATPNVRSDLRRLAARLRKGRLRGPVVTPSGRRVQATIDQAGLAQILLAGDLNPTLRAELPGSMRAALRGDPAPLLRLGARSTGLIGGLQSEDADSDALFLTTTCEESPFPWTRGASPSRRAREAVAAAQRIPRGQLGPFSPSVAIELGTVPLCLGWPTASPAPTPPGPLPAVRTLALNGRMDMRTPAEDAAELARRIPGARLVVVPHTGHSVLGSEQAGCAAQAVATFFAGGMPEASCPRTDNPYAPTPKPPPSLGQVRPRGAGGRVGRTLAAVRATMSDAARQVIGETLALGRVPRRVGGLRAGTVTAYTAGGRIRLRLRNYEYVPRVKVSGTFDADGAGTLRVSGRSAAVGTVTFDAAGNARGRLGGRRVATSLAASSGAAFAEGRLLRKAVERTRRPAARL